MLLVKIFVTFSLIVSCNCESSVQDVNLKNITKDSDVSLLWEQFKRTYNKHYVSVDESTKRFEIFAENVKKIIDRNEALDKGESSKGLNRYSDYTDEEYRKILPINLRLEMASPATIFILCIFLPPLAVCLEKGCGFDTLINIILCVVGLWIGGIIHAFCVTNACGRGCGRNDNP